MSITALPVESRALSTGNEQTWKAWLIERIDPQWRVAEWDSRRQVFTGDVDNEMTAVYLCRVDRCMTVVEIFDRRCRRCERHRKLNGTSPSFFDRTFDPDSVPRRDEKAFSKVDFELSEVNGTVAAEIIYGVQQRDRDQIILVPMRIRSIVSHLPPDCRSLLDVAGNRQFEKALGAAAGGVFRSLVTHLQRAHVVYSGTDPTMADVWKPAVVGLQAAPDRRYSAAGGVVDFREIRQRWLREITKQFGREVRPPVTTLRHTVHAAEIASLQLSLRTNGDHPELLDHGDMSAVVEGFRTSADREGKPHSFTHRRSLLGWWRRLLEFSRRTGAMDDIPGSFALDLRSHTIAQVETSEDDFGRTIPEHVIAQLDQHLELLGRHSTYSAPGWNPDDYAMMYQTVYQIIRDTGRRPSEIVGLKRSCLDWVDGKPTLVYDNRKRRRMGRRLPISTATATVIDQWLDHLQSLSVPDTLCDWLFPTPGTRNNIRRGHLSGAQFGSRAFAIWIDAIPELVDERLDDDGNPALYDRSMITPYGLRHSYAQRHADNGTPVDVLRELMDHRSVDTTMGYFSVTLKRKRQATEEISKFAIDRHGRPAGFTSVTEYERQSVAVPFGNCTEPSNIKAGGQHCPIRFQCAGCSFYRPDPSYRPAIEQHLAELRTDKETAIATDSASWVITNFDAQIHAFTDVISSMDAMLADLPADQRAVIDNASRELRKARTAAAFIPLESVTTHTNEDEQR